MEDNENISKDSWVFIEKSAAQNESEPNTEYYFKPESSGVQELIEDDLGSNESCDSDGISVPESSGVQELIEDDLGSIESCDSDGISVISESECLQHDSCTCLPKINNKDDGEIIVNKESLEIVDEIIENPTEPEPIQTNEEIIVHNHLSLASTVAGVCILITYLISNYTATYDTQDVAFDDFDDYDMLYNDTCDFNNDFTVLNTDLNNLIQSYKIQSDTEKTINQNDKRDDNISRNSKNKNKQKNKQKTLKMQEIYLKKKDKFLSKKEKYLKRLEKHMVSLEARFRKIFNKMNKKHKRIKTNATGDGDWYQKMSFGRQEIRHKEKLSDWMFERSKMRNMLRDKAHWYFNRANGREEIRTSENLRSGKRNNYKTYRY